MTFPRSNNEVLDELADLVNRERPRYRLHVHPDDAMWICISTNHAALSPHVRVVPDPQAPSGQGWYETLDSGRWAELQALVGRRVVVETARVGRMTGVIVSLDDNEAVLDVADDDRRYLPWITIEAVS